MKPKNAPKSRKTHCLVGFFAAKTEQKRASAGNFGFAPKNFYRKIRCLSPKIFAARCYTNFLRKNAVFHGREAFVIPGLRGRRRYGVKSLSFAGFMAKNTPFSCIMRAKDCACSLPGQEIGCYGGRSEAVLPSHGGVLHGGFLPSLTAFSL